MNSLKSVIEWSGDQLLGIRDIGLSNIWTEVDQHGRVIREIGFDVLNKMKASLILIILMIFVLASSGCRDASEEASDVFREIEQTRGVASARKLLHLHSDGVDTYLKRALITRAMVDYPTVFEQIIRENLRSDIIALEQIDSIRERCFEYFPELQLKNFKLRYQAAYGDRLSPRREKSD